MRSQHESVDRSINEKGLTNRQKVFIRGVSVFSDIRLQLNEQLRCLDIRMEAQVAIVAELQDFFRRRAELELDYSKSLDKLARSIQLRHKEQKQKCVSCLSL